MIVSTDSAARYPKGILSRRDLFEILWQKLPSDKEEAFHFIQRFEIVLPSSTDPNVVIIPGLLPAEEPSLLAHYWPPLKATGRSDRIIRRLFGLRLLMKGMLPRTVARVHQLPGSFEKVDILFSQFLGTAVARRCPGPAWSCNRPGPCVWPTVHRGETRPLPQVAVRGWGTELPTVLKILIDLVKGMIEGYATGDAEEYLTNYEAEIEDNEGIRRIPVKQCQEAIARGGSHVVIGGERVELSLIVPDLRPPATVIEPSEVHFERILGTGGYGTVWLAKWKNSNVAVKFFHNNHEETSRSQLVSNFLAEVHNMRLLIRFDQ